MKTNKLFIVSIVTLLTISSVSAGGPSGNIGPGANNPEPTLYGTNKVEKVNNSGSDTGSGYNVQVKNMKQRKLEVKAKIKEKHAGMVDGLINAFNNKFKNLSPEKLRIKYEALLTNTQQAMLRIEASNIPETKKEAYRNVFEYVRVAAEEKLLELGE